MTSFAVEIEPGPQPRLAAFLALAHAVAGAGPWLAHAPPALAAAASAIAALGLWASLAWVPGHHCRLRALALAGGACRARLAGDGDWQPAELTPAARAWGSWVVVEVRVAGRRHGWLLPRASLPEEAFRRLKALIRLA